MLIKKKVRREKKKREKTYLRVEEKRSWGEKRKEAKERNGSWCFLHKGKKKKKERKRRGSFVVKWKILFIKVFYQQFYRQIIKY